MSVVLHRMASAVVADKVFPLLCVLAFDTSIVVCVDSFTMMEVAETCFFALFHPSPLTVLS